MRPLTYTVTVPFAGTVTVSEIEATSESDAISKGVEAASELLVDEGMSVVDNWQVLPKLFEGGGIAHVERWEAFAEIESEGDECD